MLTRCFTLLIIMLLNITTHASNNVGINVSISVAPPLPPAHIVMTAPRGYQHCYTTNGVWSGRTWIPTHRECVYSEAGGSSVWVSGYWSCMVASPNGDCARWQWNSHRWIRGAQTQVIHGHQHNPDLGYTRGRLHGHEQERAHEHRGSFHHSHN